MRFDSSFQLDIYRLRRNYAIDKTLPNILINPVAVSIATLFFSAISRSPVGAEPSL
jgi:hypothetical protein